MGSPSSVGVGDEMPEHQVTVPNFEMWQTEVTVAQYTECVDEGACTVPNLGTDAYCDPVTYPGWHNWLETGRDDHPVNCVDWNQSRNFCFWAGARLPSESEWEYVASNGSDEDLYPWGDTVATCSFAVMDDDTHTDGCDLDTTWPVCSIPAGDNDNGLCDLAGNVWEWCEDDSHGDYLSAPADGSAWIETPHLAQRVLRGGGATFSASFQRASKRGSGVPDFVYVGGGFRCAR